MLRGGVFGVLDCERGEGDSVIIVSKQDHESDRRNRPVRISIRQNQMPRNLRERFSCGGVHLRLGPKGERESMGPAYLSTESKGGKRGAGASRGAITSHIAKSPEKEGRRLTNRGKKIRMSGVYLAVRERDTERRREKFKKKKLLWH